MSEEEAIRFWGPSMQQPCDACSAPCCKSVVLQHPAPTRWMDLDFIRYLLGFPRLDVLIAEDGRWSVRITDTCRHLDVATTRCTVHGTPRQPATCRFYSPHHCWYRRNFHGGGVPVDVIVLDAARFEKVLEHVELDAEGMLVGWPGWRTIKELLDGAIPSAPASPTPEVGRAPHDRAR